jgi:hypothetical protein
LSASSVQAQAPAGGTPRATRSLKESARAAAITFVRTQGAQPVEEPYRPGGMKPGYFWTSIGLLAAGGLHLATAAALGDDCGYGVDCSAFQGGVALVGAAMAGAGAIVWVAGKRHGSKPQVTFTPGGVAVRGRFRF